VRGLWKRSDACTGRQFGVGAMIIMGRTDRRRVYLYEWEIMDLAVRWFSAVLLVGLCQDTTLSLLIVT